MLCQLTHMKRNKNADSKSLDCAYTDVAMWMETRAFLHLYHGHTENYTVRDSA